MVGNLFADPLGSRPTNVRARDLARAVGDEWAWLTASMNLVWTHLFRQEFDDAERLLDEVLPVSERFGYLELQAWNWLGRCFRPWTAGDVARVVEFATRALEFARAAGEPSTETLAQCFLASTELSRGDAQAAVNRLEPSRNRAIAAGAGLALSYAESFLAPARVAVGAPAESRHGLEASGRDRRGSRVPAGQRA